MTAGRSGARDTGFTMVELVVTLVIFGVLASIALPRFQDNAAFTERGISDQVLATLRYAQKLAITKRREVCVTFFLPPTGWRSPSIPPRRPAPPAQARSICPARQRPMWLMSRPG